jgi:hypothetical protein
MLMMYQYWIINCNKCTILMQDANERERGERSSLFFFFLLFFFVVLEIEFRALHLLGKYATT